MAASSMVSGLAASCWTGVHTYDSCCLPPPDGNPDCWDDVYTYNVCCVEAKVLSEDSREWHLDMQHSSRQPEGLLTEKQDVDTAEDCWTGSFTHDYCCVPPPSGNPLCWDDTYTFARCCKQESGQDASESAVSSDAASECWDAGLTFDMCCMPPPYGNHNCWDEFLVAPYCGILRYYRCNTPYRAILVQGGQHSP